MAPQTAAAAPHQAQAATPLQWWAPAPILDRDSKRAADEIEQQAWHAHIISLPSGAEPRLCHDCAHFAPRDTACRKIITAIDAVFGPSLAKCHDARKSDGPCGFAATLFAHPSTNLPADYGTALEAKSAAPAVHHSTTAATEAVAACLLDADLWPVDSELVLEIRAMFLAHWGMDNGQADARMSRLNYGEAVAALPQPAPGAIGSAFGGGIYAGIIRGVDGGPDQHLVLLDGDVEGVTWEAAGTWAESKGASLPTRAEQRLLIANLPDQFEPRWYWSSEQAGPSLAWDQDFYSGGQLTSLRSYEGRARAVRRLPI